MRSTLKIIVFDFHADHSRKLPGISKTCRDAVSKGKQAAEGILTMDQIRWKRSGIPDSLCFCRGGENRRVINAIGVFPEENAVAF